MSEDVVNFFHGLKPPIATSLAGFTASSLLGYDLTFGLKNILLFLSADALKLCGAGWGMWVNGHFRLSPEIFHCVQVVRTIASQQVGCGFKPQFQQASRWLSGRRLPAASHCSLSGRTGTAVPS